MDKAFWEDLEMKTQDIQLWTNQYFYKRIMQGDIRRMAAELRINEKVVDKALQKENASETALVFHYCIQHIVQKEINLNDIYAEYFSAIK